MTQPIEKPLVYLETTVISYLTARQSRDVIVAAQQEITRQWWSIRNRYRTVASVLVIEEASAGDPQAAADRLAILKALPLLQSPKEALTLAAELVRVLAIPPSEQRDAAHVAIAAANGVDYLLTWNCAHLANLHLRGKIERACREQGFRPPLIGTPIELLENEP